MACLSKSSVVINSLPSLEIKDVNESGAFWCRASWKHFQWVSHLEPIHLLMLLYDIVWAGLAILQLEEGHQTISWCCYLLQFSQWRAWPGVTNTLKTIHQAWNEHKLVTLHIPIPPCKCIKSTHHQRSGSQCLGSQNPRPLGNIRLKYFRIYVRTELVVSNRKSRWGRLIQT